MRTELASSTSYIIYDIYFYTDLSKALEEFKKNYGFDGILHEKSLNAYTIKSNEINLNFNYNNIFPCNLPYDTKLWQLVDMIKDRIINNKKISPLNDTPLGDFIDYEFLSHNYRFKVIIEKNGEIYLDFIKKIKIR